VRHLAPGFWGFLDVLAGLALERAGRPQEAKALRHALDGARPADGTAASAAASRMTLAAIEAFAHGDHARACGRLRTALPLLGGSLPQRELLETTLIAARQRAGGRCPLAAAA
jgi:hypothetical protein